MFQKQESYFLATTDTNAVLNGLASALTHRGMAPPQSLGAGLTTIGPPIGNGVSPRVQVMLFPGPSGTQASLTVKAEIDSGSMVLFVIAMLFFWPIAFYFGYIAYQTFERAAADLLATMRHSLSPFIQAGGQALGGGAHPGY